MGVLDFESLFEVLAEWPAKPVPDEARDSVFERVGQVLRGVSREGRVSYPGDLAGLLHHILRRQSLRSMTSAQLRAPHSDNWPTREQWRSFGLLAHSETARHVVLETAPWAPDWLDDADTPLFEDVFFGEHVRRDMSRPIDPFVGAASRFAHYVSAGQREAVRSAFLMPAGEALIVSLPTGSGKSLVAQAPILVRGLEGPLTICVVPTTALALDQARQMTDMLAAVRPGRGALSLAWHAGLSAPERAAIKAAIRSGQQGILYCSPEALTRALLPALYDAARAGLIGYLIVDEAHLVGQWGDGFRPAFQLLAGVRDGLLRVSPTPGFRTILMSATLTPETLQTLDALFGPASQMVASLHLRPEIQYWVHRENSFAEKTRKILEIVRLAPRPFILYATKKQDAVYWRRTLQSQGYGRLRQFDGDTPDADRLAIIEAWSRNEIDGVVATSAFGVGIDKSDVRTVIHATVPETLDRFYQEVGRGGRDGRPSASIMVYSKEDLALAERMGSSALISDELGFDRWSAMHNASRMLDQVGALLEIDLDTVPPKLAQQTDYNQAWNMRTLIMMARAGVIELRSLPPEQVAREEGELDASFDARQEGYWAKYFRQVVVNVREGAHRDASSFEAMIRREREKAQAAAAANRNLMSDLLAMQAEVSELFEQLYRNHQPGRTIAVTRVCGGCPAHRREGQRDTNWREPVTSGIERVVPRNLESWRSAFPHLRDKSLVLMPAPDAMEAGAISPLLEALVAMFGVREIVIPSDMRERLPVLETLHRQTDDGVLLVQDLEEEMSAPTRYRTVRVTVLEGRDFPTHLLGVDRPLHVVIAPKLMRDPLHPERLLGDTGSNVLSIDQFSAGVLA